MSLNTDVLTGGFSEPVFQSQSVFKMMMDGLARPGTIQTVSSEVAPPAPLGVAAGAIALTLCDHDTSVWLSSGMAKSPVPAWLSFHTGTAFADDKVECDFAFAEAGTLFSSLGQFSVGTQEYPDRSTTLVLEIEDLEGGTELALSGPGIRDITMIAPKGVPDNLIKMWTENRAQFPRGVDLVLSSGRRFLCLPRTTKITATEM